jgi:hypothetical protein
MLGRVTALPWLYFTHGRCCTGWPYFRYGPRQKGVQARFVYFGVGNLHMASSETRSAVRTDTDSSPT